MQCTVDEIEILEEDPVIGSRKIGDNRKRRLFGFDFFDPDDSSFESASSNAWSRKHRHDEAPKGRMSERAVCQRGNRDAPAPPACPRAVIDLTLSSPEKEMNQSTPPRVSARNAGGVRNLDRDYKGSIFLLGKVGTFSLRWTWTTHNKKSLTLSSTATENASKTQCAPRPYETRNFAQRNHLRQSCLEE